MVADWIAAGLDPEQQHALRAVARARARRAVPAAVDDDSDAVARAGADLQGTAGAAHGEGPVDARVSRLSAAADRRRHHLRRALRAGRRGPGARTSSCARDRAPLPQLLRRGLRRAAAAADDVPAAAGPRQPEDEQELSATRSTSSDDAETVEKKVRQMYTDPEAGPRRHPRHGRGQPGLHLPRRVQPRHRRGRRPEGALSRRQGRRRRGEDEAGEGAERLSRSDPRAARRGAREAGAAAARSCTRARRRRASSPRRRWIASGTR